MVDISPDKYAEVVFPIPVENTFIYSIPENLQNMIARGSRVLAPFGARYLTGFVVALHKKTELTNLKEISDVLDGTPAFSQEMLALTNWIAEYYFASWGEVLDAALPAGINLESKQQITLSTEMDLNQIRELDQFSESQKEILCELLDHDSSISQLQRRLGKTNLRHDLNRLKSAGLVLMETRLARPEVKPRSAKHLSFSEELDSIGKINDAVEQLRRRYPRQAEILEAVCLEPDGMFRTDLVQKTGASTSSIKGLIDKGLLKEHEREISRDPIRAYESHHRENVVLSSEQQLVIDELDSLIGSKRFSPVLLHGVTGSGKTQIYLEALTRVRHAGGSAIVLVPEIALTPQTVGQFKGWFGDDIAVLHSRMSGGERYDSWRRIKSGAVHIVIGPRSAVLAPLVNIGLIVVDEEQEGSYKQQGMSPRYHARDVALMRGKLNNALVILGSATPSIETYHNAISRKYRLLQLAKRVENLPLPDVQIVDMAKDRETVGHTPILSGVLHRKIEEKLQLQEQIILLQNRRGFSTFILCWDCGFVERCKNCNITLTYHLREHLLRCHYCDFAKRAPDACPGCGGIHLGYKGTGTQRVEEELKHLFPSARTVRMDMDTTTGKGAHYKIIQEFRQGKYDILLGTQMVAKGLDFPRVTLVGVISADTTLKLPDFRASERTFQLMTQVAGRAGRKGKQGEVIIQTFEPGNHSLKFAQQHAYLPFYTKEISERQELGYPPYSRIIVITFRGVQEEEVQKQAADFSGLLKPDPLYRILGPAPSPLSKLKGEFRYRLILKYDRQRDTLGKKTRHLVKEALDRFRQMRRRSVKITIDVDPVDLF